LKSRAVKDLSAEQRREVASWIDANCETFPEPVRVFLALHQPYLAAEGDPRKALEAALRELRRALHITPSTEKRRTSGSPLSGLPPKEPDAPPSPREKLEGAIGRGKQLRDWHGKLNKRHNLRIKRLEEQLAKMPMENKTDHKPLRLEDMDPPTEAEIAENKAAAERFGDHLRLGDGPAPAMKSVNETLMPGGAVLVREECVPLAVEIPEDLADAQVIKTINEPRVRYDFSVAVTRLELNVEKKVLLDQEGDRHVITASTLEYGPPRYSVTWETLATLAVLVGQFALPFNRLGTLFSTPAKRFTAGALSRMLHYVAERFVPIYLELVNQLADCAILAGDDTSCRVLEVSSHHAKLKADPADPTQREEPPWAAYRTPNAAEKSLRGCEEAQKTRMQRRSEGDREAKRTPEETPSLGMIIGRRLGFESPRKNGDGPKEAMHVTVVSGRSVADDPKSLIVLYRSHLGSCGNLFEAILKKRDPKLRDLILQGDLSTTNLVTSPEQRSRFNIRLIGCYAHARRPFALYADEDPERCEYMLHLFLGLAIYEERLDAVGRNRENVLAVRQDEGRETWNDILRLAKDMADKWSKGTKLGIAARYIINHFPALTAYLDNPNLEPTNNLRERMLRTEKLIEGSSMFRRSLEGRFVLDVIRTLVQTAVAAGVPVLEYLVWVLRASDDEIKANPDRFTPRTRAAAMAAAAPAP